MFRPRERASQRPIGKFFPATMCDLATISCLMNDTPNGDYLMRQSFWMGRKRIKDTKNWVSGIESLLAADGSFWETSTVWRLCFHHPWHGIALLSFPFLILPGLRKFWHCRYARTFAFFYTIGLHALVFICLYRMSALSHLR